jgi:hypothetical protein
MIIQFHEPAVLPQEHSHRYPLKTEINGAQILSGSDVEDKN